MSLGAMKRALGALENAHMVGGQAACDQAITALRLAIEQAERQEPVAHLWQHSETGRTRIVMPDQIITADANWFVVGPLYLAPPQRQPLTDAEIMDAWSQVYEPGHRLHVLANSLARAIERKHGIGGGE